MDAVDKDITESWMLADCFIDILDQHKGQVAFHVVGMLVTNWIMKQPPDLRRAALEDFFLSVHAAIEAEHGPLGDRPMQ